MAHVHLRSEIFEHKLEGQLLRFHLGFRVQGLGFRVWGLGFRV